jgi:hypothetical protein
MLKGSSSLTKLRCSDEESKLEDLPCQKPGFSGGAGCKHVSNEFAVTMLYHTGRNTPLSFISRATTLVPDRWRLGGVPLN